MHTPPVTLRRASRLLCALASGLVGCDRGAHAGTAGTAASTTDAGPDRAEPALRASDGRVRRAGDTLVRERDAWHVLAP